ncbi:GNAT family N-acetyltransferase [Streptomyces albipurpureus]|uniref:GNAT family N-acetyltransferase n=1 Tax=Streptomyces albipurpureus TaxID=2897419 RepID=A0ABT0UKK4_9ACTN|nr:GNAT family N-acetyltransferase [Streptomyces sp. CWNU-1]MCM2387791.1 GNAT family N-acetyltransferase [Streptomyces sp. CWNU-1]
MSNEPTGVAQGTDVAEILSAAARGEFPPADGTTTVVRQPSARDCGVLAFTAHSVVFVDEDPIWVRERLAATPTDPLAASMHPAFLSAMLARTGRSMDAIDVLTVAAALPGAPDVELTEIDDHGHPRVARALRYRDGVRAWKADGGMLVLGQGLAGRWECSVEVDGSARGRGLGVALARAARQLVPGEAVWAQIAPGNARSVRAFQRAGFRPVGSEALFAVR